MEVGAEDRPHAFWLDAGEDFEESEWDEEDDDEAEEDED